MEKNLISIILPAFNVEKTLSKSIESVLDQTYGEFELIILDDGSTDATAWIAATYSDPRIILIRNESNIGLVATLNKGIGASRGKYVARIDGDDAWKSRTKLEEQAKVLDFHPDIVLVGTQARFSNGRITAFATDDISIRSRMVFKNQFIHSSVLFRKNALEGLTYDGLDYLAEDYALWLKLGSKGKLANLASVDVDYLLNPEGETRTKNVLQTVNSLLVIRKYGRDYPHYHLGIIYWTAKFCIRKVTSLLHLK